MTATLCAMSSSGAVNWSDCRNSVRYGDECAWMSIAGSVAAGDDEASGAAAGVPGCACAVDSMASPSVAPSRFDSKADGDRPAR